MPVSTVTTLQGETWDMLAYRLWGVETLFHHLVEANRAHQRTLIFPAGVVLIVPVIALITTPVEVPPWQR